MVVLAYEAANEETLEKRTAVLATDGVYIHTQALTHTGMRTRRNAHTLSHRHTHARTHYPRTLTHTHTHTRTNTHTHTHARARMHACTHTHTRTNTLPTDALAEPTDLRRCTADA